MKLYTISGLGADQRVFQYLKLDIECIPLDWIDPLGNESIATYARRLSERIDTTANFGILGLSFGGLVAVELTKQLKPSRTILISTVETKQELRWVYRLLGRLKILRLIPRVLFDPPRFIAHWLFGTSKKKLLNAILKDTDLKFAKWAVNALVDWQNQTKLQHHLVKINGTKDKLIPHQKNKQQYYIENGAHFMIVDRADEISAIINKVLKEG